MLSSVNIKKVSNLFGCIKLCFGFSVKFSQVKHQFSEIWLYVSASYEINITQLCSHSIYKYSNVSIVTSRAILRVHVVEVYIFKHGLI